MEMIEIKPLANNLNATVNIPGSKSYTNRALILAALATGKSELIGALLCDDTQAMIVALKNLGVNIEQQDSTLIVHGTGGQLNLQTTEVSAGLAGTTSRFITALAALADKPVRIDGMGSLLERPIDDLVESLKQLGVKVTYLGQPGCIPLLIDGKNLKGDVVEISGKTSSQFVSALLMISPLLPSGLTIKLKGQGVSHSYIDMTIAAMHDFGVSVANTDYQKYVVEPGQSYGARTYHIEGDWSTASYFCALGALHQGSITLTNLNNNSVQGDRHFPQHLASMGIQLDYHDTGLTVSSGQKLRGIKVDMANTPDTAMTLAIVAAFATGVTQITGLSTLKIKESDRLAVMQSELAKMGIKSQATTDSIEISGGQPHAAEIQTHHDHRVAMSFAVAGSKVEGLKILAPAVVNKSCPMFWDMFADIGIQIEPK